MERRLVIAILIFAHMMADFIFQSNEVANNKRENFLFLIKHTLVVCLLSLILTLHYFSFLLIGVEIIIAITHLIIDLLKIKLAKTDNNFFNEFRLFLLDQVVHIIIIVGAYSFIDNIYLHNWAIEVNKIILKLFPLFNRLKLYEKDWYIMILIICGYIFIWTPASFMVDKTLVNFKEIKLENKDKNTQVIQPQAIDLPNPGELIGKLERVILLTLILSNNFTAIPIIFTAKSIARFNNFKNKSFVDYYIIGTFVSLLIAIIIGLFLNLIIYLEGYGESFIYYHLF